MSKTFTLGDQIEGLEHQWHNRTYRLEQRWYNRTCHWSTSDVNEHTPWSTSHITDHTPWNKSGMRTDQSIMPLVHQSFGVGIKGVDEGWNHTSFLKTSN